MSILHVLGNVSSCIILPKYLFYDVTAHIGSSPMKECCFRIVRQSLKTLEYQKLMLVIVACCENTSYDCVISLLSYANSNVVRKSGCLNGQKNFFRYSS